MMTLNCPCPPAVEKAPSGSRVIPVCTVNLRPRETVDTGEDHPSPAAAYDRAALRAGVAALSAVAGSPISP
jgi:hypothetical protein